jgi:dihydroorotase-like cyclic amidohydrolase
MSANPARLLTIADKKGKLQKEFDADIVLVNPDETLKIDGVLFCTKGKYSPFDGKTFTGKISSMYKRGKKLF